ncbi:UPF0149 family protein [Prosthecochloris sp. HL-130-GSB]|uniref:UPF0149 family protein n=1 Tax=Prosthecochloris sp. HL-130-GSB TaxID=1974213 RepID=UPI000A1C0874|nr:UPF0149 family protein [Prosthecochloris sp. HL-130-GSB]ARM30900.1 hypothetical protein B9H02_05780 [Prosthecochloris sp. HL-130-GSB]
MFTSDDLDSPLSAQEMTELEDFLLSEKTSDNAMTLDMLDGYLTSVVIGPETLLPDDWMPYVWGLEDDAPPEFGSEEEVMRIMGLLLRYMNSLAGVFIDNPDAYLPLFERCSFENEEDEDMAVESWAYAFAVGIELCRESWKPLFDDEEASGLLLPVFILGKLGDEWDTLSSEELAEWRDALPEAVAGMYEYWLELRMNDEEG